jgi:excisionase family DNA binding protein
MGIVSTVWRTCKSKGTQLEALMDADAEAQAAGLVDHPDRGGRGRGCASGREDLGGDREIRSFTRHGELVVDEHEGGRWSGVSKPDDRYLTLTAHAAKMAAMRQDELLRPSDAARRLGVTIGTLRVWDRAGQIRCLRTLGNQRRIPRIEVWRLANVRRVEKRALESGGPDTLRWWREAGGYTVDEAIHIFEPPEWFDCFGLDGCAPEAPLPREQFMRVVAEKWSAWEQGGASPPLKARAALQGWLGIPAGTWQPLTSEAVDTPTPAVP